MKELLKQLWTIPNMLTILRIIAVPFIMWCTLDPSTYIECGEYTFPIIGLVIMIVAASTDLVDGYIARRFNQGSQLGEMIDPLADKLMHCAAVLSLVIIGYVHWAFIVILLAKEGTMVLGGIYMAGDSKNIKANYMGKVASATLSLAIVMSYFHAFWADKVFYLDWIVLGIGLVLTYMAFFNYLKQAIGIIKGILARKKAAKEGTDVSEAGVSCANADTATEESADTTDGAENGSESDEDKSADEEN